MGSSERGRQPRRRLLTPCAIVVVLVGLVGVGRARNVCVATRALVGPSTNGGIGTWALSVAQHLIERGDNVTVLYLAQHYSQRGTIDSWKVFYERKYPRMRVAVLPSQSGREVWVPSGSKQGAVDIKRAFVALEWFHRFGGAFDVVISHEWLSPLYFVLQAKAAGLAFQRTVFVTTVHAPILWLLHGRQQFVESYDQLLQEFLERRSVELAQLVVFPSAYMREYVRAHLKWQMEGRAEVVQNFLPAAAVGGASAASRSAPEEALAIDELVFFGRLEHRKGLALFCTAMDLLHELVPVGLERLSVTFLGRIEAVGGQRSDDYISARAERGRWKVPHEVLGGYQTEEALRYLRENGRPRRKLAVICSLLENLPYVVMEVLAYEIPFIATDVGGTSELIAPEDRARVLFIPTAQALAEKLAGIVAHGYPVHPARPSSSQQDRIEAWDRAIDTAVAASALASAAPTRAARLPAVTICIPSYERPALASLALESVRAQDYPNLEVVMVDDGSQSADMTRFLDEQAPLFAARQWTLIRRNASHGVGAARNAAVRAASGEYVVLFDNDDYLMPHAISTMVRAALLRSADVVTCWTWVFHGQGPAPQSPEGAHHAWLPLGGATSLGFFHNTFGAGLGLFRREAYLAVGGSVEGAPGLSHIDHELYARLALSGYRIELVPAFLYYYRRQSPGSILTAGDEYRSRRLALEPFTRMLPAPLRILLEFAYGNAGVAYSGNHQLPLAHAWVAKDAVQEQMAEWQQRVQALAAEVEACRSKASMPSAQPCPRVSAAGQPCAEALDDMRRKMNALEWRVVQLTPPTGTSSAPGGVGPWEILALVVATNATCFAAGWLVSRGRCRRRGRAAQRAVLP